MEQRADAGRKPAVRPDNQTYLSLVFCKIHDSYYALEAEERKRITSEHVGHLRKFSENISHLVCTGFNGQYDQVMLIESRDLRTIHDAVEFFRMGNKARHIEVVDTVFGIKVENKSEFAMVGNR